MCGICVNVCVYEIQFSEEGKKSSVIFFFFKNVYKRNKTYPQCVSNARGLQRARLCSSGPYINLGKLGTLCLRPSKPSLTGVCNPGLLQIQMFNLMWKVKYWLAAGN